MCVSVFSMVMCIEIHFSQIEQEMSLVICKRDVKSMFLSKWKRYICSGNSAICRKEQKEEHL